MWPEQLILGYFNKVWNFPSYVVGSTSKVQTKQYLVSLETCGFISIHIIFDCLIAIKF